MLMYAVRLVHRITAQHGCTVQDSGPDRTTQLYVTICTRPRHQHHVDLPRTGHTVRVTHTVTSHRSALGMPLTRLALNLDHATRGGRRRNRAGGRPCTPPHAYCYVITRSSPPRCAPLHVFTTHASRRCMLLSFSRSSPPRVALPPCLGSSRRPCSLGGSRLRIDDMLCTDMWLRRAQPGPHAHRIYVAHGGRAIAHASAAIRDAIGTADAAVVSSAGDDLGGRDPNGSDARGRVLGRGSTTVAIEGDPAQVALGAPVEASEARL